MSRLKKKKGKAEDRLTTTRIINGVKILKFDDDNLMELLIKYHK